MVFVCPLCVSHVQLFVVFSVNLYAVLALCVMCLNVALKVMKNGLPCCFLFFVFKVFSNHSIFAFIYKLCYWNNPIEILDPRHLVPFLTELSQSCDLWPLLCSIMIMLLVITGWAAGLQFCHTHVYHGLRARVGLSSGGWWRIQQVCRGAGCTGDSLHLNWWVSVSGLRGSGLSVSGVRSGLGQCHRA